jgi:hypothetical protein
MHYGREELLDRLVVGAVNLGHKLIAGFTGHAEGARPGSCGCPHLRRCG